MELRSWKMSFPELECAPSHVIYGILRPPFFHLESGRLDLVDLEGCFQLVISLLGRSSIDYVVYYNHLKVITHYIYLKQKTRF